MCKIKSFSLIVSITILEFFCSTASAQPFQQLYTGSKLDTMAAVQVFQPEPQKNTGTGLLIFPGGGYAGLSLTAEGINIGRAFAERGITCFVVRYRLPDKQHTQRSDSFPLADAVAAMRWVKERSATYQVDTKKIGCIGFSAGGHLAATFENHAPPDARPAFAILVYPVISMDTTIAHRGSRDNLLGMNPPQEWVNYYSNELQVTQNTPPTYITHTGDDKVVPVQNAIRMYEALQQKGIPAEMHLLPFGDHGFIFALPISEWIDPMIVWLKKSNFLIPVMNGKGKKVVLTFDDAIASHYSIAAPLLKKYGFDATFYVCEFPPDFADSSKYLNWRQIQSISKMGFEIGNHTWHHTGVNGADSAAYEQEITWIEKQCKALGIRKPTTYAYPGCGTSDWAPRLLKKLGYKTARTCEPKPYVAGKFDPYLLPSYSVQGTNTYLFYGPLEKQQQGETVIFLFHGVPDNAHSWVNTPQEIFEQYMKYLKDHQYTVLSMKNL